MLVISDWPTLFKANDLPYIVSGGGGGITPMVCMALSCIEDVNSVLGCRHIQEFEDEMEMLDMMIVIIT